MQLEHTPHGTAQTVPVNFVHDLYETYFTEKNVAACRLVICRQKHQRPALSTQIYFLGMIHPPAFILIRTTYLSASDGPDVELGSNKYDIKDKPGSNLLH